MTNLNARPGINGNTPESFELGARRLYDAITSLRTILNEDTQHLLHGRNYQHLDSAMSTSARIADRAHLAEAYEALDKLTAFAVALNHNAKGA